MTCTLGGTAIPVPLKTTKSIIFVGSQEEAHDGTLLTEMSALKDKWKLQWFSITTANRAILRARFEDTAQQVFIEPDGGSANVRPLYSSWSEDRFIGADGNYYYDIGFELEEVS